MKVTPPQIRAALKACNGKVSEASVILGIARPNLYKRMGAFGIDPDEYRPSPKNMSPSTATTQSVRSEMEVGTTPAVLGLLESSGVAVSSGVILTHEPRKPTLVRVTDSAAAKVAEAERPKRLRITRSFYLRPDQAKAIDEACLDLPAVLREPMSPSRVMERFMDESFPDWLAKTKRGEEVPAKRQKKDGERG